MMALNEIHQVATDGPNAGYLALLAAVIHQAVADAQGYGKEANEAARWVHSLDCQAVLSCLIPYGSKSGAAMLQTQLIEQLPKRYQRAMVA